MLTVLDAQGTIVGMETEDRSLRAARVGRGWSQAQAAEALAALATARGVEVAAPSSLKTQLSRWENQHVVPEEHYRALLREVYGRTDDELGLAPMPSHERNEPTMLLAALAAADGVDDETLTLLRDQLAATSALDHRLGSAAVAESLSAQLSHLERVLIHAVARRTRREVAHLVSAAAILAARVAADTSRPAAAWRYYEQARRAAQEAGSASFLGCAMVEQARLLSELGRASRALELAEWALELATPGAAAPTLAWMAAGRGDVLALAGLGAQARSAYRLAEEQLSASPITVDISFPQLLVTLDHGALHRHRGHGLHLLRDDDDAIADLEQALQSGGGSVREVAGVHVDLAHAFGATNDLDAAESHARRAREMAARIGSSRLTSILDAGPGRVTPAGS